METSLAESKFVSNADNLQEMSNLSSRKNKKTIINLPSSELIQAVLKIKI